MVNDYFDKDSADPADGELRRAITLGVVPVGCLVAGHVVMSAHTDGVDPCGSCDCDRKRCGGRSAERASESSAAERAAIRKRHLEILNRLAGG